MPRGKRISEADALNRQIEAAEADVAKAKKKFDEATDNLNALLEKKKKLRTEELLNAITNSGRSYDEILSYIQSESAEEA